MADPFLDHACKGLAGARIGADIQRHRECVRAAPIGPGTLRVDHVELARRFLSEHGQQRRMVAVLLRLDDFRVGEERRAIMKGDALWPEKELAGAQYVGVIAFVQRIAQDEMNELVQEYWRRIADAVADEIEISCLDGARGKEPIAEREHYLPVLARIGIFERGEHGLRDGTARRAQKSRM